MGFTGWIIGGLLITIFLMGALGSWYYKTSQAQIAQLHQDVATERANVEILKGQIEIVNESVRRLEKTRTKDQNKILALSSEANNARRESADLKRTFAKHDLENLSLRKPGLIEKIINRGTKRVNRDFEKLTTPPREEVK